MWRSARALGTFYSVPRITKAKQHKKDKKASDRKGFFISNFMACQFRTITYKVANWSEISFEIASDNGSAVNKKVNLCSLGECTRQLLTSSSCFKFFNLYVNFDSERSLFLFYFNFNMKIALPSSAKDGNCFFFINNLCWSHQKFVGAWKIHGYNNFENYFSF